MKAKTRKTKPINRAIWISKEHKDLPAEIAALARQQKRSWNYMLLELATIGLVVWKERDAEKAKRDAAMSKTA